MKKLISGAIIFAMGSLSITSCKKTDIDAAPQSGSSIVSSDPSLSIFAAIVTRSGDATLINSSSAIMAPVDSAFTNAGITAAVVSGLSPAACDSIVRYYSISTALNFSGATNTETSFTSELGASVDADSTSGQLYLNGASVVSSTPVLAGSTAIYKLTKFISLPTGSVAQLASADANLSLFNEAFNKTGFAANIGSGNFTLFAPTNAAFIAAGYPDIASIDAADINTLTQILEYHTVANTFFANDLLQQTSLTTLQTGSLQLVNTNGNLQLIGNSSAALPANIISNGQLAGGNVWVYKIDNVLLP